MCNFFLPLFPIFPLYSLFCPSNPPFFFCDSCLLTLDWGATSALSSNPPPLLHNFTPLYQRRGTSLITRCFYGSIEGKYEFSYFFLLQAFPYVSSSFPFKSWLTSSSYSCCFSLLERECCQCGAETLCCACCLSSLQDCPDCAVWCGGQRPIFGINIVCFLFIPCEKENRWVMITGLVSWYAKEWACRRNVTRKQGKSREKNTQNKLVELIHPWDYPAQAV